jgi:hypothetical protein
MPSIGQTWFFVSIGAVVEMGILSTLPETTAYGIYHFIGTKGISQKYLN